ncbi:SRPBCC family protein [Gordonia sp. X0973]|uniref:SRPBCC family protein n=1 Tax=Gordonia sp. X0973 TaxID=2742602 RepID=UPI000F54C146|nr:SRPBCC family protein [Gordonia sp. X0973]QKT08224.1 SRPBCC family protein [Gordonia sp. X0973]
MRYRDQPTVEVEAKIGAAPERVWRSVADISLPVDQPGELYGAQWIDGASEPAVGAQFVGRNRSDFVGEWETLCTVVDVEPGRRWVWSVAAPEADPWAQWGFEVDPSRDGSVVRQFVRMGLGWSPLKGAIDAAPEKEGRIIAGRMAALREAMTANLEEVRRRCEGDS